ncbi:UDP-N-acetylmuramoyl-L-alanine--D-glutamate ligase [Gleimia sp. 6138-11-ORH1]|uniref:UDP-N-acetylmuramoyl-L-alanine--D-glutamate ligase n=1 Tax=Gleimia sp. 6138-11-ORH1 TaxID=2973937 RepID=UPI002169C53A|nr:UDP-N-acetylmuramoyl-L-alanine--D-glutamate ligase [Gleimia sp. 6138-11-ORH1]MCS4484541.1 UDP-N-acetylmuramoyl-L-alanine--D-glutamate ligase [Gleimia sp. 6138-11-ORH1]
MTCSDKAQLPLSDWHKLTFGVFGLGKSGSASIEALLQLGVKVIGYDARSRADLTQLSEKYPQVEIHPENTGLDQLSMLDYAVVSPGIAPHSITRKALVAQGVVIWSEIELAWQLQQSLGKETAWLTVTGTNGKTTTVGIVGEILKAAQIKHAVVGNIGKPIVTTVLEEDLEVMVVELSSFQLETTHSLSAYAAVCLNVDSDHLDWHGSTEHYRAAKAKIYENTQVACVYDAHDKVIENMVANAEVVEGARAVGYTLATPTPSQIGIVEDLFVDRAFVENRQKQAEAVAQLSDIYGFASQHPSVALVKDTLAAIALTRAYGVSSAAIAQGLQNFKTAEHRRSIVGQVADMVWINDSKATNTHAALASLNGFPPQSIIWIAGGDAKGQDFHELVAKIKASLRGVVVIGSDPTAVVSALKAEAPQIPYVVVSEEEDLMFSVVNEAVALSKPGDTVVLAPACASWDQFENYAQRGDLFVEAISRLDRAWQKQYGEGAGK